MSMIMSRNAFAHFVWMQFENESSVGRADSLWRGCPLETEHRIVVGHLGVEQPGVHERVASPPPQPPQREPIPKSGLVERGEPRVPALPTHATPSRSRERTVWAARDLRTQHRAHQRSYASRQCLHVDASISWPPRVPRSYLHHSVSQLKRNPQIRAIWGVDEKDKQSRTWSRIQCTIFVLLFQLEKNLYLIIKHSMPDL